MENTTGASSSLGNFININSRESVIGDFRTYLLDNSHYMHEYGHTLDSRFNPFYLLTIAIPSALNNKGLVGGILDRNTSKL